MNDALLVGRFERVGDLPRDRDRVGEQEWPLADSIGERRTFDQLHDERAGAVHLFEAEHLRDVRVIQRRQDLGFALEAREPIAIGRQRVWQHLDRHLPLERRVFSSIDLAHSPFAQLGEDAIAPEIPADHWRAAF